MARISYRVCYFLTTLLLVTFTAPLQAHPPFDRAPQKNVGEQFDPRPVDILYEDFEGAWLPTDWVRIVSEPFFKWHQSEYRSHSGQYSAAVEYSPQGLPLDEWLVTPGMDFNGYSRVYLEFYEDQQYWGGFGERHSILVSTTSQTDPAAFTPLIEWTPEDHEINGFDGEAVFLDLSAYIAEPLVYLAFRYEGTWADNWFVDDVRVFYPDESDAAALATYPDQVQFAGGETIFPEAVVINLSGEAFTFDVSMEILESGTPVYLEFMPTTLEPAERDTLEFPPLQLNSGQYYKLYATTHLLDDQVPENDQIVGFIDTYTQEHTPLGWLHTNAGSGSSAPADILMDTILAEHPGELALVRLHTWWPGFDIMYEANIAQCDSFLAWNGIDYVPHFWVDGIADARFNVDIYESYFLDQRQMRSPQDIQMVWNEAGYLSAKITNVNPLDPEGVYRLITVVTEDSIPFFGGNGIEFHNQAFRHAYPSVLGLPFPAQAGIHEFEIPCDLDPGWNLDQLSIACFIQELQSRKIWQAAGGRLSELRPQFYFDPSISSVGQTGFLALPIVIHPGLESVMGMELEVEFDPNIVELLEINPGNWFTESGHPYYFFDYTPDSELPVSSIHFAAALLNASSAKTDTVAICRFRGLNLGATSLDFLDVDVRNPENYFLSYEFSLEDSIIVDDTPTGIETDPQAELRRLSCSPNPFNPRTELGFNLPNEVTGSLVIYDVRGRVVKVLRRGHFESGQQLFPWDGRDDRGREVPSGLYLANLNFQGERLSTKMVLLR